MGRRARAAGGIFGVLVVTVAALSLVASATAAAAPGQAADAGSAAGGRVVPGSYIVTLEAGHPSVVAADHAGRHGAQVTHVYEHALLGYAARMSAAAAQQVARDPRVASVEPERLETIQAQTLPTGIDRIETDQNPKVTTNGTGWTVGLDIAVLDTGIASHPDLNLEHSVDCTAASGSGPPWARQYTCTEVAPGDGNGHGTHVAGTIGAIDNGSGVVGVAPGVRLWSVQVCGSNGSCPSGAIVAGIDWVAGQKKAGTDFVAANFSISSADSLNSCSSPANATHAAICGLVDTGVSFVMAAGNDNREKKPYPVAFSVSGIADFDGAAGGAGSPTCRSDTDDTLANFSNYGEHVDIAAPGVCILSTWNNGGYNTISGTSMATPHATGAVALYLHANGFPPAEDATGVAAIENAIIGSAHPQGTDNHLCSYDDARVGGPLLFVNASALGGTGSCRVAGGEEVTTGTIAGTVTSSSGGAIAGATVAIDDTAFEATTDAEGSYTLSGVPEGTYSVTASATDHAPETKTDVVVTADATTPLDFELQADDATPPEPGDAFGLEVRTYKVRGVAHAELTWSALDDVSSYDVYRGSTNIGTDSATSYVDNTGWRGSPSTTYQVCAAGDRSTCSEVVAANW